MARFWQSPAGKYPPGALPYIHSDVEPAEAFDLPKFHQPIEPRHDPKWLDFSIGKALAGFGGPKPTPEEFVAWFQPGAEWTRFASPIIQMVMADIHRHQQMPGLWRLRDTLGLSIYDIAAAMRRASVTSAYPCLWINRYAWNAPRKSRDDVPQD